MSKYCFYATIMGLLLMASSLGIQAQEIRSYSNEFLSLGVGARALAMGNVQVASVNNVTAGYWNPAGLNAVNTTQIALMHSEWFAGIAKYDYLSIALPISDGKRTLGISAIRLGVDDIPNTLNLVQANGSINYDNITAFSVADYAFLVSMAQEVKRFSLGANAKVIYRNVGSFATAWGFGLDAGAQFKVNNDFTLGLMIRDLTTTVNTWSFTFTDEEKEKLALTDNLIPTNSVELTGQRLILGAAYNLKMGEKFSLLTEADFDFTFDGKRNVLLKTDFMSVDPHLGIEMAYDKLVFVRAGINNIQQFTNDFDNTNFTSIQPNVGLGLKIKAIELDYAFTGLNRTTDGLYSHVVSLIVNFNR